MMANDRFKKLGWVVFFTYESFHFSPMGHAINRIFKIVPRTDKDEITTTLMQNPLNQELS